MKNRKFVVVLTQDEEEPEILNVTVPALPGCFTWGVGRHEAMKHAKEAISLFLESLDEHGETPVGSEATEVDVFA